MMRPAIDRYEPGLDPETSTSATADKTRMLAFAGSR